MSARLNLGSGNVREFASRGRLGNCRGRRRRPPALLAGAHLDEQAGERSMVLGAGRRRAMIQMQLLSVLTARKRSVHAGNTMKGRGYARSPNGHERLGRLGN